MKNKMYIPIIAAALFLSSTAMASEKPHWGYQGDSGPEFWGSLNASYSICSSGKNQSPINLTKMIESELNPLAINYKAAGNEIVNNGHTIQVNYKQGSTIETNGHTFELKQLHFHSPSENTIEGQSFPLEAHFVHMDTSGNLAVIGVMYEQGEKNSELEKAWSMMPAKASEKKMLPTIVDANLLLPKEHSYYRFNGSLTTPPCSEGVLWMVMKTLNSVSSEQIKKFTNTMHHPNNRPVQALHARPILQ